MPARDKRFSQVGENSAGDRAYRRTYITSEMAKDLAYYRMTKDELQELLRERDLPISGNKDELIERLQESD